MGGRILFAGILGGIALFVWGVVAHMVLGLGDGSFKGIPNEEMVLSAMQENIPEPGLYFFPWIDMKSADKAAMEAWTQKYKTGPAGIMVFKTVGGEVMTAKQMITQLVTDILSVLFAVLLLAKAVGGIRGYMGRVVFMATFGLITTFALTFPYWNWYGFPFDYVIAGLIEQVVGFFVAGLVVAGMLKPKVKPAM